MSGLLAAGMPSNMRSEHIFGNLVESDVFDIANRVKEIDPDLRIFANEGNGFRWKFVVSHIDKHGNEYFVLGADELDARIIEQIQYMLHVPFEKRFAECERIEKAAEDKMQEDGLNELYERMGRPMWTQLERCGFIQRQSSYAKSHRKQAAGR